jgi:hypothetical protein
MKNSIIIFLLFAICYNGVSQRTNINSPKFRQHIETEELAEFITADLKIDSTIKFQSAMIFIQVNTKGKVTFLNVSGELDNKFKKIVEDRIKSPLTPWLKKNKKNSLWYVFPVFFGHIQNNYSTEEMKWRMLYFENNMNSLRELENDNPGNVVILRTHNHLTNKGMQQFYD